MAASAAVGLSPCSLLPKLLQRSPPGHSRPWPMAAAAAPSHGQLQATTRNTGMWECGIVIAASRGLFRALGGRRNTVVWKCGSVEVWKGRDWTGGWLISEGWDPHLQCQQSVRMLQPHLCPLPPPVAALLPPEAVTCPSIQASSTSPLSPPPCRSPSPPGGSNVPIHPGLVLMCQQSVRMLRPRSGGSSEQQQQRGGGILGSRTSMGDLQGGGGGGDLVSESLAASCYSNVIMEHEE